MTIKQMLQERIYSAKTVEEMAKAVNNYFVYLDECKVGLQQQWLDVGITIELWMAKVRGNKHEEINK